MTRVIAALLLTASVLAQESPPVFRGSWTATASPSRRRFQGSWSGQALPRRPNAAHGSWALLDDRNRILLQGTWTAEKSGRGWQGRWSARVMAGRSAPGRVMSGSWRADSTETGATLADMLQRTLQGVTGTWLSGRLKGTWGVRASRQ